MTQGNELARNDTPVGEEEFYESPYIGAHVHMFGRWYILQFVEVKSMYPGDSTVHLDFQEDVSFQP